MEASVLTGLIAKAAMQTTIVAKIIISFEALPFSSRILTLIELGRTLIVWTLSDRRLYASLRMLMHFDFFVVNACFFPDFFLTSIHCGSANTSLLRWVLSGVVRRIPVETGRAASERRNMTRPNCSIPDDHIDPRRSALFMARSILHEVREGVEAC